MAISFSNKKTLNALGIMNGTSLDGVDFVLIQIQKRNLQCTYIKMKSFSFPVVLKKNLGFAASHLLKVDQLALLHHELGRFYASCFKKLNFGALDVVGLHGQTVFHQGRVASLQIGEPSYLAAICKCPVISDFRVADIALGGEGAPIATFFHQNVFGKTNRKVSVHNLGGISNLTLIQNSKVAQGFDTGPANMLIDLVISKATDGKKQFDKDGLLAKQGFANLQIVNKMMKHKFLNIKSPKSCGREEFGLQFLERYNSELKSLSLADCLATLTEFSATSIAHAYLKHSRFMPAEIIFCGGGVFNKNLLSRIKKKMPFVKVSTVQDYGWPSKSIEGAAFALLAAAKLWGIESNLPQSTGSSRKVSLGKITII